MNALQQVVGTLALWLAGCALPPLIEAPDAVPPGATLQLANPHWVALGPQSYPAVWENAVRAVIDAGFEIGVANRFDGRIESKPRIAPGCFLFFKAGSYDPYERLLATLQTYRHRISVAIQPADNGGFFISVIARKELEDLPKPLRATAGAALFQANSTVERTYEVVDPVRFEYNWIPKGRDPSIEQDILRRMHECM